MTPEDRHAILSLVHYPGQPPTATPEDLIQHLHTDDGKMLGLRLLRNAIAERNATDVELAMIVCNVFGFDSDHLEFLLTLTEAQWHHKHEDVVSTLGDLRAPEAVDAFYQATQWVPDYLDYDDSRALARKAIRALGRTPGPQAEQALTRLLNADDEILREESEKQLDRRQNARSTP
jgi:hypothetical protein